MTEIRKIEKILKLKEISDKAEKLLESADALYEKNIISSEEYEDTLKLICNTVDACREALARL